MAGFSEHMLLFFRYAPTLSRRFPELNDTAVLHVITFAWELACEFHVVINERQKVQFLKSFYVFLNVHQIFQNFESLYIVLHTLT